MKQTRRTLLRTSSAAIVGFAGIGTAQAADYPPWKSGTVYTYGDTVTHNGTVWKAKWWTRGDEPGTNGEWGPWKQLSETGNGSGSSGGSSNDPGGSDGSGDSGGSDNSGESPDSGSSPDASTDTVFAPYDHLTTNSGTSLVDHAKNAGTNSFTLAFILDDSSGNAAWDGSKPVASGGFEQRINALTDQGGTPIVSFGGANGTMLSQSITDTDTLKSEYETVVDTYGTPNLDFDIEHNDKAAVKRCNEAVAKLQKENPDVTVSFTLRVRTNGLTEYGRFVVADAKKNGVEIDFVNVMTMNYGWVPPHAKQVKSSATGLHEDLGSIYSGKSDSELWEMVGITPMIGVNNAGGTFRKQDAKAIAEWAGSKNLGYVSFWSIDRDNGGCQGTVSPTCSGVSQKPYEFSEILGSI